MPVVVEFSPGIPKKDRAAVQKRMFVRPTRRSPARGTGSSNGTQAYYRAPEYWQPDTKLTVRIALEGIPLSNGRYGNVDRKASTKIGSRFEMKVDNATKQMTVFENGKLVRTMPVSLGKKSTPSSSGTMVVMEKKESTVFDTTRRPGPGQPLRHRHRLRPAADLGWRVHPRRPVVGGRARAGRNVSHGCVNLSTANARWLFDKTKIGDPITVKGTERKLADGNGWTAWDMSWEEFVKGSALPVVTAPTVGQCVAPDGRPDRQPDDRSDRHSLTTAISSDKVGTIPTTHPPACVLRHLMKPKFAGERLWERMVVGTRTVRG